MQSKAISKKVRALFASLKSRQSSLPLLCIGAALAFSLSFAPEQSAEARTRHAHAALPASSHSSTSHASAGHSASRRGHSHAVVAASSSRGRRGHAHATVEVAHHGRHHHIVAHQAPKTRYAYPINIFMHSAPAFDSSPLSAESAHEVVNAFNRGTADNYPARTLVRAGIVKYFPLHGGIFWRREPIKYIVMHSTETGIPISATHVINGWNSMGMRHPGAQYVVDRDGTIYQAVDPDLATVHVNIFKTLPGINNDNSIGIEMNHNGSQDYPAVQREAVIRLVGYLKHRYNIDEGNIITHRYAQQGDHTDPVNFDWDGFLASVNTFHNQAIAYRGSRIKDEARRWQAEPEVKANTLLKPHRGTAAVAVPPSETGPDNNSNPSTGSTTTSAIPVTDDDDAMNVPANNDRTGAAAAGRAPMGESPVPEPSEADVNHPASTAAAAKPYAGLSPSKDDKNAIEMKVYTPSGKAPLPGTSAPSTGE